MQQNNYSQNYHVLHAYNFLAMLNPQARVSHRWYDFDAVAIVTATSPDEVFEITNQQDEVPWTTKPEVVWCKNKHLRSTSVGDVITNQALTRSWLVLRDGFQEISRIFYVQKNGISISCEKRGKDYVLLFSPMSHAESCREAISRSGRWSGVWHINDGCISFPEDLTDETRLREIAEQYVDGKQQFEFSEDQEEDEMDRYDEEDGDGDYWEDDDYCDEEDDDDEDYREDGEEDEDITRRIPCGGYILCTVPKQIVEAFGAFCRRFGNTVNTLRKECHRKKLL